MAHVEICDGSLVLRLTRWERLGAFHGDVSVPLGAVCAAAATDDMWGQIRGVRWPGTGLPYVIMLGTARWHGQRDFCVVYRGSDGLVVELEGVEFARLLVTLPHDEAQALATRLTSG